VSEKWKQKEEKKRRRQRGKRDEALKKHANTTNVYY